MAASGSSSGIVRVGLAGLGRFGKLHASVLGRFPHVQIAAVCDPIQSEVDAAVARFEGAAGFTDIDAMLAEAEVDAYFLVTPEQFHHEHAKKAIARGFPVFMEKPLSTTAEEGALIAQLAADAGVYLQIGFVLRFEMQHAMLKEQIDAGKFGEIVSLRLKRNCSRAWFEVYGDRAHSVHETIVHDIDLAIWFTGSRASKVYAVERNISGLTYPDATMAIVQFESGAMCALETAWLVPGHAPANVLTDTWHGTIDAELEINGTKQVARLRLLESGLQIWTDEITQHPESGMWPELYGQVAGALREEDAHFIDRVLHGDASRVASVADAVEGLRIAEAIIESASTGREISLR